MLFGDPVVNNDQSKNAPSSLRLKAWALANKLRELYFRWQVHPVGSSNFLLSAFEDLKPV